MEAENAPAEESKQTIGARFYVVAFLVIFYYWFTRPTSGRRSVVLDGLFRRLKSEQKD